MTWFEQQEQSMIKANTVSVFRKVRRQDKDLLMSNAIEELYPNQVAVDDLYPTEKQLSARPAFIACKSNEEKYSSVKEIEDIHLLAIHGWLCPEGKLYSCSFRAHDKLVQYLGFNYEYEAEDCGWVKLTNCRWLTAKRFTAMPLNKAQWHTIESWYRANQFSMRHFYKLREV
jgi:hypothetical protein